MAMKCMNCNHERLQYHSETDAYHCLNCTYQHTKQYFFISHSHLDIEKVRVIRNIIEETFFYEPILFFLKCLSDEEELQDLIRREIYERIWFVYCKSENAERSAYVQQERAYLADLLKSGKRINVLEIDLDHFHIWDSECYDDLRAQIAYHIRTSKIFLSYARADREVAEGLHGLLSERGFSVFTDLDMKPGDSWAEQIESKIRENSYKDGLFLLLVSKKSLQSGYVAQELRYALENKARVLLLLIDSDCVEEMYGKTFLSDIPYQVIDSKALQESCDRIVSFLHDGNMK